VRTFGKYRLVEPLASGGMADVWRAEVSLAAGVTKEVALKLVRGEHAARSEFVEMFIEEARLASRLSHANVVQVFEFDQVDGRYYIAMELVHGRHLGQVVDRARESGLRLGLARVVHVGAEVAKGLAYAHRLTDGGRSLGLVHRDVSPHNMLVSFEGEVKLADFGIARAMSRTGLTAPGTVKGKVAYMAPEQARGEPVDARADVFALGVVLWELCTGRRLFARDSDAAALAAVLHGEPPSPPSAWNEAVPGELDAAILGALARDPASRTGSAQELASTLGGILLRLARSPDDWDLRDLMHRLWPDGATPATEALERTRVRATPLRAAAPALTVATRTGPAQAPARRTPRVAAIVGAVGIVALGGVGAWWKGRGGAPTATPTPISSAISEPPAVHPERSAGADAPARGRGATPQPSTGRPEPVGEAQGGLRAEAEASARHRGAAPGFVRVTAFPGWGKVFIDGRYVDDTPTGRIELPPGRHHLRVTNGRVRREQQFDVGSGLARDLKVDLKDR
jgi:tRNA A-37 threonylcarbamoyl transferase component Bud32